MNAEKVDNYLMMNAKFFDATYLTKIKRDLQEFDESRFSELQFLQFKDPSTSLLISIFGGHLGIDRFVIGDTGMGIAKLFTCGGLGIWTIIDLFLISDATREKNYNKIQEVLARKISCS